MTAPVGSKLPPRQIRVSISHLARRPADDVKAVRLAEPVRARPAEPRCGREHERAAAVVLQGLEGVSLDRRALVDVAAEDELRARSCERPERSVAVLERELPRGAPRGPGEVVMADDDAERVSGARAQHVATDASRVAVEPAALVAPGTGRVEPADDGARSVRRTGSVVPKTETNRSHGRVTRAGSV